MQSGSLHRVSTRVRVQGSERWHSSPVRRRSGACCRDEQNRVLRRARRGRPPLERRRESISARQSVVVALGMSNYCEASRRVGLTELPVVPDAHAGPCLGLVPSSSAMPRARMFDRVGIGRILCAMRGLTPICLLSTRQMTNTYRICVCSHPGPRDTPSWYRSSL